ncbi:hypothetical protein KI387_043971 [Taxus chinensis]|uniref:Uncharacterized protein n=1 Tax=Taxus chinensis TaxID=29808 RepID=A0AA38LFS3_TAXCH|nr:hypothetical protein KI387_043971 [Taxus chinensis]
MHYRGAEGGRFPKALMCVIWEMVERNVTFAWAPAYFGGAIQGVYGLAGMGEGDSCRHLLEALR